jgi:hypothetical protein
MLIAAAVAGTDGTSAPSSQTIELEAGVDWYFVADQLTWADYLRLGRDGRYNEVSAQHMGIWETDTGQWEPEGDVVRLRSDAHYLDVVLPPLRVFVSDKADLEALPRLASAISRAVESAGDAAGLSSSAVHAISVPTAGREGAKMSVYVDAMHEFSGLAVPLQALRDFRAEIDRYLQAPDRNVFRYRVVAYKEHTMLLCLDPGGVANMETIESLQQSIDDPEGGVPSWIFAAVSKEDFEEGSKTTYPFKYYPEMNRKPE